jgi:hypothetical protein
MVMLNNIKLNRLRVQEPGDKSAKSLTAGRIDLCKETTQKIVQIRISIA